MNFFCVCVGGGGGGGRGGRIGNNFFLKQIFLRGHFWDQVLEERLLYGGNFTCKNILEDFCK